MWAFPSHGLESVEDTQKLDTFKKLRNANISLRLKISKLRVKSAIIRQRRIALKAIKKTAIPILEEVGNEKLSKISRWMYFLHFLFCTASVALLCWYLYEQTTNNPISEGVQRIHVSNGSFPSVAVFPDSLLEESLLLEAERILKVSEETFMLNVTTAHGVYGPKEKIAIAFILGQLTAYDGPSNVEWFPTVTRLVEKYSNSIGYQPPNNVTDPVVRKALSYVKRGIKKCSSYLTNCTNNWESMDCDKMFGITLTGKGLGCVFNQAPYPSIEKDETIRSFLSNPSEHDTKRFKKTVDMDKITFSKEFLRSVFLSQKLGGIENGIRFKVTKPPSGSPQTNRFLVSVGNPRDPISLQSEEEYLEYGTEHLLALHVFSEYTTGDVRKDVHRSMRECVHYSEMELENYIGYTYARCNGLIVSSEGGCSTISDGGEPSNRTLCQPSLMQETDFKWLEEFLRHTGVGTCEKSCNELRFETHVRWRMLFQNLNTSADAHNQSSVVRIFYPNDMIEANVRTLRTFTAEKIGIVLGMLGFCNEITLPRICQFLQMFFLIGLKWFIRAATGVLRKTVSSEVISLPTME